MTGLRRAALAAALAALAGCNVAPGTDAGAAGPATLSTRAEVGAVDLTSRYRQAEGMTGVGANRRVQAAAQAQAAFMAQTRQMTHAGPGDSRAMDRLVDAGYRACYVSENIAFGQPDVPAVMSAWMNSASHRRNILSDHARVTAVGVAQGSDGLLYWAMVLAAPC